MKMEILLELTSNKLMVGDLCDSIRIKLVTTGKKRWTRKDGGICIKVKEFQRSFRHSDTERLSRSDEVLKLKNFKKEATLKLSKSTNQEWYEHVDQKSLYKVDKSQDGETRLCLVDDLTMLQRSLFTLQ
ncbi:hypothetical protein Tco_1189290 [Tanacetum coccineum]